MIHRLDHPFRAFCTGVLTLVLLSALSAAFVGFGVGLPEFAIIVMVSVAAALWAGHDHRRTTEAG